MTNMDGRTLTPTAIGIMNGIWNSTQAALNALPSISGGPYNPVLWHKKGDDVTLNPDLISGITSQQVLATQRRRLRKVSRHKRRVGP
jgi:hypothetical protein